MTSNRQQRAELLFGALQNTLPQLGNADSMPKEISGESGVYLLRFACMELAVADEVLDHEENWSIPDMVEGVHSGLMLLLPDLETLRLGEDLKRFRLAEDSDNNLVLSSISND